MANTIGTNIDAWCGRCKLILAHTIETLVDEKVKRVHCNTCGATHAYKANAPGTGRGRGSAKSRSDRPAAREVDYAAMLRGRDPKNARPYGMDQRFQVNDLIQHSTFGLGLVLRIKDNTKIEVAFELGLKVLAQAGPR